MSDEGADHRSQPRDPISAAALDDQGLGYGLVDTNDENAMRAWLSAVNRGFHWSAPSDDHVRVESAGVAYRRTTGVWDPTSAHPEVPVGTVSSWTGELVVPGGRTMPAWAISTVTVAPTHRRRGMARALLEGELRTARALGVPVAMLTVSESTIYRRFGFAPAAMAAKVSIDTKRVSWSGPSVHGRVEFVDPTEAAELAPVIYDRARLRNPGQMDVWQLHWRRMCGLEGDDAAFNRTKRVVRFVDPHGEPQGLAIYRATERHDDFANHIIDVDYLLAATDDAYAALWRFFVELDLVGTVRAHLRSVDEAVVAQVSDPRRVHVEPTDHLWLRILDVPASLEARTYSTAGRIAFDVSDPLGFANGRFVLDVDGAGVGRVSQLGDDDETPSDAIAVALGVNELSAILLGGVRATTLVAAGLVDEEVEGAALGVDTAFMSPRTPWLSVWF